MAKQGFNVTCDSFEGGRCTVRFTGDLRFQDTYEAWEDVREMIAGDAKGYDLDLTEVGALDGGSAALLIQLKNQLLERDCSAQIIGAKGPVRSLLDLYGEHAQRPSEKPPPARTSIFDHLGTGARKVLLEIQETLDYLGDLVIEIGAVIKRPRSLNWPEVVRVIERSGPDAVSIVVLINFLIGLILAIQAGEQLRQYGADLFVANLVGVTVVRELGPLMTAIILAGRSGAAFAAEIGTMKVSEELDAMVTMGLSPYRMLVFPRWIAMIVVMPLLTILADAVGVAGGMLYGITAMDLTVVSYLKQTQSALDMWDLGTGVLKSVFFGTAIALIGCLRGKYTEGGAVGVGRATTQAVVTSIFVLIALDAVFTVLFQMFQI